MRVILGLAVWLYACDVAFDIVRGFVKAGASEKACAAVTTGLIDPSQENREKAARDHFACHGDFAISVTAYSISGYLRRTIEIGNSAAQVYVLLGRSMNVDDREFLEQRQMHPTKMVQWSPDSQLVSESLAAMIGRMRQATRKVRPDVIKAASNPAIAEAEFLLDILPEIDDKEVISQITKLLEDTRVLPNRNRRVCDYAVPALSRKFKLRLSFEPSATVFTDEQLIETRRLTANALK
jgi:hypothetical protein